MNLRRLLAAVGLGAGPDPNVELLSKADATRLFGLSKDQWLQEVRQIAASGGARETPGDRIPGVSTITPEGDLLTVRLDYSEGDNRPAFIQVVVGYAPARAALFNDGTLRSLVDAATREMEPEFMVMGDARRIEGGLAFFFEILRSRAAGAKQ